MPNLGRAILLILLLHISLFALPLKKVTLQLSWFNQFQFAGYYIAKEKGYYEAAGLDVEIIPFEFGIKIPQLVEEGKVDFGIGRESLIIEYSKGRSIVAIYALFQASPLVLLARGDSGIESIHDFKNKRIMITSGDSEEASVKAIMNSHHLNEGDYKILEHSHDIGSLVRNETDVISAYLSKTPYDLYNMEIPFRIFYPRDYGFDLYSDFLFTSQNYLDLNLETVLAFKQASLKGWEYAYENIQESAKIIHEKYNSQNLTLEALIYEAEILRSLSYFDSDNLGQIDRNKLRRIYDLYNVMGLLPNPKDVNNFVLHHFGVLSPKEKSYLKTKGTLTVCSDPDWIPHEYMQDGKLKGISAAYLERFESLLGVNFTYLPSGSWDESLTNAMNHQCDILTVANKTPQRSKYLTFTSPYFYAPFVIATKTKTPFITDIKNVMGEPMGYVKGYAVPEVLKQNYPYINLIPVKSIKEGLDKVANGTLYGFIDSLSTINYVLQKHHQNSLKIAGRVEGGYVLSFGIRSDEPLLVSIMEKALSTIDEQTRQTLNSQWSNVQIQTSFDYALMWKILAGLGLLSLLGAWRFHTMRVHNGQIQNYLNIIDEYVIMSRTDLKGNITYVSQALCRISGYTKDELMGKPQSIFRHPKAPPEDFKDLWQTIQSGKTWHGELINLRKDKTPYWVDVHISPIFNKNAQIEGYSAFQYDITDKKEIERLSRTDPLTQIANRLHLDNCRNDYFHLAKRHGDVFSILLLDLDYFKSINDSFGHRVGDSVLVEVAGLLRGTLRQTDILGRWGGEEFLVICPQTTKDEAMIVAEKIRVNLQKFNFPGYKIRLTCSIGVAQHEPSDKPEQILERADSALYRAKEEGRNRVVVD